MMEPIGGDLAGHDHEFEEVRWIPFSEAAATLTFETERALVARAAELVDPGSVRAPFVTRAGTTPHLTPLAGTSHGASAPG